MKDTNWRSVTTILPLGVFILWLNVWTSAHASGSIWPWIVLGLPILLVGFSLMTVAAWLRRRKSSRTWDLMLQGDPSAAHFITFVYPLVKIQLGRLGWRLHGSAFASIPAIGVSIGFTAVTFWEAGTAGPTLALAASDFKSAAAGRVSDGFRSHPAIELRLNTANRSNRLQLNLRDVRHHNLSPEAMHEALERFPVMNGTTGSKRTDS